MATIAAVREELGRGGYVYRFRHDRRPFADAEGAFLLCGSWMALEITDDQFGAEARVPRMIGSEPDELGEQRAQVLVSGPADGPTRGRSRRRPGALPAPGQR